MEEKTRRTLRTLLIVIGVLLLLGGLCVALIVNG
jgi:hypothetical protein